MRNSPDIQDAIAALLDSKNWAGGDLAAEIGVTQATISRWVSGIAKSIKPDHWAKLAPLLEPHLPTREFDLSEVSTAALMAELQRRLK